MKWNRFDIFLFLLVLSISGGHIGGALLFPRILAIFFLPHLIVLIIGNQCNYIKLLIVFFSSWWFYGILSFFWTSDKVCWSKEIFYYIVTFSFFLEIVVFSKFANNPLKSLSLGWCGGFVITALVAIWELVTNKHLSVCSLELSEFRNMGGGVILLRRFASATFGNYNTYVTYICLASPFLLYLSNEKKFKIFSFVFLAIGIVIVGYNASRGGIVSLVGIILIYLYLSGAKKIAFIFLPLVLGLSWYGNVFEMVLIRMDKIRDGRVDVWFDALNMWVSSVFIGTGMGSMIESMKEFSTTGLLITHNIFLEILCQYGFLIFIPFVIFLIILFKDSMFLKDLLRRNILLAGFIMFPLISIINSGYLLEPYTAAFFASFYVFAYYEHIKYYC